MIRKWKKFGIMFVDYQITLWRYSYLWTRVHKTGALRGTEDRHRFYLACQEAKAVTLQQNSRFSPCFSL